MTFLEAIKKAQPGQIIKNKSLYSSFVILTNNKVKALDEDCTSVCELEINDTNWEIE